MHLHKVHGQLPYDCQKCGAKFATSEEKRKHWIGEHLNGAQERSEIASSPEERAQGNSTEIVTSFVETRNHSPTLLELENEIREEQEARSQFQDASSCIPESAESENIAKDAVTVLTHSKENEQLEIETSLVTSFAETQNQNPMLPEPEGTIVNSQIIFFYSFGIAVAPDPLFLSHAFINY